MKNKLLTYCLLSIILIAPVGVSAIEINIEPFQDIPFLTEGSTSITNYIDALYLMAISIASLLVVFRLMWAGVEYMLTESVIKKNDAKSKIGGALLGLVIILSAVTILETINPNLTNLNVVGKGTPAKITEDYTGLKFISADDLYFDPGDIYNGKKIIEYCNDFIVLPDDECEKKYVDALYKSCAENAEDGIYSIERKKLYWDIRWGDVFEYRCIEGDNSLWIPSPQLP